MDHLIIPDERATASACLQSAIRNPQSAIAAAPLPVPVARTPVTVRPGTLADVPFMDALQKRHARAVGWMPTRQLEAKVGLGQVLVAVGGGQWAVGSEEGTAPSSPLPTADCPPPTEPIGYAIASDRYFKRDDVGVVYQMNVLPGRQRGLIGATLLAAVFERAAYGCKLFCCWCAQDLAAANAFWAAMGFVPLAFRTGSRGGGKKGGGRTHIFWQRRVRAGDVETPYWYPSQTSAGSIREDRLVLPIPPGTHWSDAKPVVVPGAESAELKVLSAESGKTRRRTPAATAAAKPTTQHSALAAQHSVQTGGLRFGAVARAATAATTSPVEAKPAAKQKAPKPPAAKNDPKLVAAARELRDRYLEQFNRAGADAVLTADAKYDVGRRASPAAAPVALDARPAPPPPLLLLGDARAA